LRHPFHTGRKAATVPQKFNLVDTVAYTAKERIPRLWQAA
jgi:hypothetical protein